MSIPCERRRAHPRDHPTTRPPDHPTTRSSSRSTMARMPIRIFGDPILRERASEVVDFDASLARLAEDMMETMRAAAGAGLAATQVGVLKRLFTWDVNRGDVNRGDVTRGD